MRKLLTLALVSLLALEACHKAPSVPVLALEECDPAGYIACIPQEAFASIPVADTGVYLTYSSRWASHAPGQNAGDANRLGLGGWSINFVQRYDKASRLFISGDGSWRLTDSVALPSGEQVVPSYDGALAYIFDSAGHHVRTVDAHLGIQLIAISYDSAGRLEKVDGYMNSRPVHVSIQRDSSGRAHSFVGMDGGTTALGLDENSRLASVTDPAGQTTSLVWNAADRMESKTDPAGGVVRFTYDASGRLATLSDPDGVIQTWNYKSQSNAFEVRVSTTLGRYWSYRTDSTNDGIRRTYTASDGTITTETTDAKGNRLLKLADGTSYTIGAVPNSIWGMASPVLTPVTEARSGGIGSRRETRYELKTQNGLPYSLTGSITTIINGQSWVQNFDPPQRTITLVDPAGRRTATIYDARGRLTNNSAPGVAPVAYTYDAAGRVASTTIGVSKNAYTTRYAYNANTGEIVVTRPDGIILKTVVDRAGQPVSATAGDGSTILATYDAAGRLLQIQPPGGFNYTLGTSPAGRDTGFAPPIVTGDGSVETTAYDQDGEIAAVSGPGKRGINYEYDSGGRVIGSTFDQGRSSISYDTHSGLRSQETDPGGVTTSYGYSGRTLNRLAWSGPVSGSVSEMLDANARPVREDVNGSNSLDFAYDAAGNLVGVGALSLTRDANTGLVTHSTLGAVETKHEFDSNGRLSRSTSSAGGKVLLDERYSRDSLGRIKAISETGTDGKTSSTEYSYDHADRLASFRVNGRPLETESYDAAGNRVSVVRTSSKFTARYDAREELLNWGPAQYYWAADGHLTKRNDSKGSDSFTYDDFGTLRGATLANNEVIKYYVDADGRRLGREVDGKLVAQYLYRSDGSVAAELDSDGKLVSRFAYDDLGHLALVQRAGVTYRVITDTLGSPRLILDSRSGAVADEITYDAWGNITGETVPGFIPIGFAGGLRDSDTGFVRFGARDYDPAISRWMEPDPIHFQGGDPNLYRYASGDPVDITDPNGLLICRETGRSTTCYEEPQTPLTPLTPLVPSQNGNQPLQGNAPANTNPPQTGNPPTSEATAEQTGSTGSGNSSSSSSQSWNCSSSGTCTNPADQNNWCMNGACESDSSGWTCSAGGCSGPNGWGCVNGTCGGNNGSFACIGQYCFGPQGPLCEAGPGQQCSVNFTSPGGGGLSGGNGSANNGGNGGNGGGNGGNGGGNGGNGGDSGNSGNGGNLGNQGGTGEGSGQRGGRGSGQGSSGSGQGGGGQGGGSGRGGSASGVGDPHLTSIDGVHFDLQAAGEFLVASARHLGMVIQVRQQQWGNSPIAINTAVSANVGGDRVGVYSKEPAFLMINNSATNEADLELRLPHGGKVERHGASVKIVWPDRGWLTVTQAGDMLNYEFMPASGVVPSLGGLLGASHGNPDELTGRDGIALVSSDQEYQTKLYRQFASSWRIKPSESLFHYWPGESTAKFTDLNMPLKSVDANSLSTDSRSKAEAVCRAFGLRNQPFLDDCVLDVGLTGMPALVSASVQALRLGQLSVRRTWPVAASVAPIATSNVPDQYTISIGDSVSPDHPSTGAGMIRAAGRKQTYLFSATAGQIIYFSATNCDGAELNFELDRPSNDSLGFGRGGCGDLGPVTLPAAGTYRVMVKAEKGAARYSFSLRPTTFDQFSIKIGDTVSPDRPSRGAGIIAQPGEQQSYSFPAQAGQVVYFSATNCEGATVNFEINKPSNDSTGFGRGGCGDLGPVTLATAGTYKILVKADRGTARYSFSLRPTTFEQYSIKVGDTVSPDHPSRGAGIIAQPGEQQSYSFPAQAGQVVYFSATNCEGATVFFDLLNQGGGGVAGKAGCGSFGPVTLPTSGAYKILVKVDHGGAARYSFKISQQK